MESGAFFASPDQWRRLDGQVVRCRFQRSRRAVVLEHARRPHAEKALASGQVAQRALTEITHLEITGQPARRQRAGRIGYEDLPAVPGGHHTCCAMYLETNVVVLDEL